MMIFLRGLGEFLTRGGRHLGLSRIHPADWPRHPARRADPAADPDRRGRPLARPDDAHHAWLFQLHGRLEYRGGALFRHATRSGRITLIYALSGAMCAIAGIIMLARFNSVRVGHGESYLLITVLACFLGGVNPFGGFGKVLSVFLALIILQLLSSGLNLLGANQHLATAIWGLLLVGVMILRWAAGQLQFLRRIANEGRFWRSYQHVDQRLDQRGGGRSTRSRRSRNTISTSSRFRLPTPTSVDAAHTRKLLARTSLAGGLFAWPARRRPGHRGTPTRRSSSETAIDMTADIGAEALSGVTFGGIGERTGVPPTQAEIDNVARAMTAAANAAHKRGHRARHRGGQSLREPPHQHRRAGRRAGRAHRRSTTSSSISTPTI